MGQASFRIILTGNPLQEFDAAQVVQAAAQLFKCSEERARQFFSGKPTPLKREMDETTAQRYQKRLTQAGIDCRIEPVPSASGLSLELEPTETPAKPAAQTPSAVNNTATGGLELVNDSNKSSEPAEPVDSQFRCPKCQTPQDKGEECIQCGIIFAKYQPPAVTAESVTEEDNADVDEWDEIALFVGDNIEAYQQKFRRLYNNGGKYALQWHWPAFCIPIPWLIFRKMYLWAVAYFVIMVLSPWYLLLPVILLPGFTGNYLYYRHVTSQLDKISSSGDLRREDIINAGSTNSILMTIGISLLAGIVMSFFMYKLIFAPIVEQSMKQVVGDVSFISPKDNPGTKTTKVQMLMLKNALLLQKKMQPKFQLPTDMDELMQMMDNPPNANKDYWGTPMVYQLEGNTLVFRSAGADKNFDTGDDIELTVNQ
jgi:hypothetical protein